ncbi:MAG: response regulator transcription factor [Dehalococcoidia bacterium]|nr:response regulator transcription factor [Dehalococcoidia bacterium]
MKAVIIEDDPNVIEAIAMCFEMRWPAVTVATASEGQKGVELTEKENPDIVIVDLGLPDIDGLEVVKEIRAFSYVPIIILTARDDEMSTVKGLEYGADDYITKPFSHIELLARVRAVLRRSAPDAADEISRPFTSGDLKINFQSRQVLLGNEQVNLTPTEFNLLSYLAKNAGTVLSHHTLLSHVWGDEYTDADDYLKVYVQRLRAKLEKTPENPTFIVTERGAGYMFKKPEIIE